MAGDITEVQLKKYLQQLFTPLPAKAVSVAAKPVAFGNAGTRTIVRNEAAPVAIFGFVGPMRADPDFIPTFVSNYIFGGGGFSARLMDQVRDKRGLTYGISTDINDFRAGSIIVGRYIPHDVDAVYFNDNVAYVNKNDVCRHIAKVEHGPAPVEYSI